MEDPRKSNLNQARWELDKVRYHLSKVPSPRRDIKPIGEILQDIAEDLEEPENENLLVLRKAWPEIAGAQIASHCQPEMLDQFALYVSVNLPGWLPELERSKRMLLQKLQSSYPQLRIRQLRFVLRHRS